MIIEGENFKNWPPADSSKEMQRVLNDSGLIKLMETTDKHVESYEVRAPS